MRHTLSKEKLREWIEAGNIILLDHLGGEIKEEELWEQYEDGWHIGVVTEPISNTIVKTWVVCLSSHRNHHGFDAGECIEVVSRFEEDEAEFMENWSNSGGMIFEVE